MTTSVCFTGPAFDALGQSVLRADLIKSAQELGFVIHPAVRPTTQMLIASRVDTVKAKKAKAQGVEVLSYPHFIMVYLHGSVAKSDGQPAPYVDMELPDFAKGLKMEDLL